MNRTTVKSATRLVASLALRHVAQRHGGAHRGWSALAAAFFTVTAIAGNNVFQQGAADGDGDYLASNSANWGQHGQVSTDADTGETTITEMSFSNPFVTTFDKLIKTTTYCWIGATDGAYDADDNWCVWRTKNNSSEYGFTQTGDNHVVMADASNQKGRLRIESGTYTAKTFQIGGNSGTAYLDVSNATLRATGDFRVASLNGGSTKGYVTIRDGATVTAEANIAIGTESGVTADVTVTNATVAVTGTSYVGRSGGTGVMTIKDDAAFSTTGGLQLGSSSATATGSFTMETNSTLTSGAVYIANDNASNSGTFTMNGGTATINGALWIGKNGTGTFVNHGGNVTATGDFLIGMNGGTGTFTLNGGEMETDFWFPAGRDGAGHADIYINGGRLLIGQGTAKNGMIDLCNYAGSSATFTMTGGYVYAPGSKNNADSGVAFAIGNNSTANVEASISGGELYLDGKICVPRAGTGSLALSGTGKITVTSGDSLVGNDGTGTFTMSGGEASFRGLNLGSTSSGEGTFNLSGGEFTANSYTCIGNGGTGRMVQTGGTYTQANTVFIVGQGGNADASGSYKITDGSLTAPALYVAENATPGTMEVAGGSVKITGDATFSNYANSGNSSLAVSAGAMDVSGQIKLAQGANTHGTITVSGGALTNHNWFCVGSTGNSGYTAQMTITGGEVYNAGNLTLASAIGGNSSSTVVVSGGKFANTGDIYIGECNELHDGGIGSASFTLSSGTVDNSNGLTHFDYKNKSVAGSTFALTISGGEYITKQIKHGTGAGTATITLGGGTLKASAGATSDFIPANNNLSIVLATGTTTTIDTNGKALTIGAAVSGTGTLRVTGGGSLALGAGMTYTGTTAVEAGTTLSLSDTSATTSRLILRGGSVSVPANFSVAEVELASGGEVALPSWYTTSMKLIISGDTTLVVPQGTTLGDVEFKDNGKIVYTLSTYTAGETANVATIGTVAYPENETIADHIYISVDGTRMATVSNANGALTAQSREVEWIGTGAVDYADGTQWQGGALTSFDIAVFGEDATVSSAHPVMKLTGGTTVTVAQALTIDALTIGAGGGSIDTGSYGVTIANVKSVDGTLGFSGAGTVTISAAPAAPVGIVLSGTVVATVPYQTAMSSVTLGEQSMLILDASGLSETYTLSTACPITLPQGYDNPDWFVAAKGGRFVATFDDSDGCALSSIRPAAQGEGVVNVYLGNNGTGSGEWSTTGQWSLGAVPTSVDTAIFVKDGTLTDNVADTVAPSNIVLKTSRVKFIGGGNWPKIRAQEINGIEGATIALSCYGLSPTTGKNLACRVNIDFDTDSKNQDCWIEGNGAESRIAFYGGFFATNSAFRVNQDVDFYGKVVCGYTSDDDNYFKDRVYFKNGSSLEVASGGMVELRGVVFESGSVVKGSGVVNMTTSGSQIAANISDALTLNLTGGTSGAALYTVLSGDNSGFTGILNSSGYHIANLASIDSGSASATWNISTDMRYTGDETGILKFGALNLTKVDWCWFYIRKNLTGLVVEVGSLNTDMTWGNEYAFGGYDGENANFEVPDARFRKVGSGTLYTSAGNYPSIEVAGGTVSFEDNDGPKTSFVFGGGTFRFNSASYADPMAKFDLTNSSGPIDIDTADHTFTWTTAIGGSFSIIKRGEGTLALTGAHTYTGKTDVKGGVLILPYRDFGSQEVAVASGAELHLDMTGVTVTENDSVPFFTTTDAGVVDRVKLLGSADYTFQLSRNNDTGLVSYIPTAINQDVPNIWIGGAEGDWNFGVNWSRGVPQATHNVVVESTADIYSARAGDHAVKSLAVNGESFTLRASNKDNAPKLIVESITGSGKIILCRAGLENASGVAMTVANDIEFGASDNGYESWLASNDALVKYTGSVKALSNCGKFAIYGHNNMELTGDVTVDSNINAGSKIENACISGNLTVNGNFRFAGCTVEDSGSVAIKNQCSFENDQISGDVTVSGLELQSSGCTFAGSFVVTNSGRVWSKNTDDFSGSLEIVHGGTFSTDSRGGEPSTVSGNVTLGGQFNVFNSSTVSGDVAIASTGVLSICKDAAVSGDISGNGKVEMKDGGTYTLSGDNSGFEGSVTHTHQGQLWFKNPKSGSAKALWNVSEDIVFDFDYTQISEDDAVIEFGAFQGTKNKRYYQDHSKKLTVKIGALSNVDSWIRVAHFGARDWKDGSKLTKLTIVKVGDGKFSTSVFGCPKFVVEEGELTFEVIADGQYSGDTFFFTGCKEINSVVVKKGSALSGSLHAEMKVASIDFEDGSYYRLTRTSEADTVYDVNSLTAANIEFGKNVYLYLNEADRVKAAAGTVLLGTVTGSPMATVLNEAKTGIAACNDEGWYWTASTEESGVKLASAQVNATKVETGAETPISIRDADLAAWLTAKEAADKVNEANDNGVTGILAYMLGAEYYTNAAKPTMGATVADGVATLTFDDSAFRRVPGLKLAYYLESCDKADFSEAVTTSAASDDPAVALELATAKLYNRLCADVRASE